MNPLGVKSNALKKITTAIFVDSIFREHCRIANQKNLHSQNCSQWKGTYKTAPDLVPPLFSKVYQRENSAKLRKTPRIFTAHFAFLLSPVKFCPHYPGPCLTTQTNANWATERFLCYSPQKKTKLAEGYKHSIDWDSSIPLRHRSTYFAMLSLGSYQNHIMSKLRFHLSYKCNFQLIKVNKPKIHVNSTKLVKLISDTRINHRLEKYICERQVMAVISIPPIFLACVVEKLRRHCKPFTQEFLSRAKNSAEEKSLSETWTLQFLLKKITYLYTMSLVWILLTWTDSLGYVSSHSCAIEVVIPIMHTDTLCERNKPSA